MNASTDTLDYSPSEADEARSELARMTEEMRRMRAALSTNHAEIDRLATRTQLRLDHLKEILQSFRKSG